MNKVTFRGSLETTEHSTLDLSNLDVKVQRATDFGCNYPHVVEFYGTLFSTVLRIHESFLILYIYVDLVLKDVTTRT